MNDVKFFPEDISWRLHATIYKNKSILRFTSANKELHLHIKNQYIQQYFYYNGMETTLLPPEYRDSILIMDNTLKRGKNNADTVYNLICRLENFK